MQNLLQPFLHVYKPDSIGTYIWMSTLSWPDYCNHATRIGTKTELYFPWCLFCNMLQPGENLLFWSSFQSSDIKLWNLPSRHLHRQGARSSAGEGPVKPGFFSTFFLLWPILGRLISTVFDQLWVASNLFKFLISFELLQISSKPQLDMLQTPQSPNRRTQTICVNHSSNCASGGICLKKCREKKRPNKQWVRSMGL